MIGLIWNCRGCGKKGLATYLQEIMKNHDASFVGLQETMKKKYCPSFFINIDPLDQFS